jgi:hypothetical protein
LFKSPAIIVRIKITIFYQKKFRPQFSSQIVADVETRRRSAFWGAGDNFLKNYEENQMTGNLLYDSPYQKKKLQICDLYQEMILREAIVQISATSHRFLAGERENKVRIVF